VKFNGPIYDEIATLARTTAEADAVILIISNGFWGNGFSVQANDIDFLINLPDLLESLAEQLREDISSGKITH
jgi:hypothetical protein